MTRHYIKTNAFHSCFLMLALLLFSLTSCSTSDMPDNLEEEEQKEEEVFGSVTAKVNGIDFSAPNSTFSLSVIATQYILSLVAFDFDVGLGKGSGINMLIGGIDFSTFGVGKTFGLVVDSDSDEPVEGAVASYGESTFVDGKEVGTEGFNEDDELKEIFVKITAFDPEKKLISGEFSFKGVAEETGKTYNITEGKFTDIPY